MRCSEWIAFLYFVYLACVCWLRPLPRRRRLLVTSVSLALLAAIWIGRTVPTLIRDWAPLVYVSVGYYLTGRLFVAPSIRFESWLLDWDRRLLGDPTTRFAAWPRWLVAYLDLVYMSCFLLLPAGLLVLEATGRGALADHYWTIVLAADLGAFAPLSVVQTRPPWALEPPPTLAAPAVHRLASYMVRNATIRVNTFPSGHVAVSLAIAFAVAGSTPLAGAVLLGLALTTAVGCVVGRYHYVVDVLAGAALAFVVLAAARFFGI